MDAVDVVARQDVAGHVEQVGAGFGAAGVEILLAAVGDYPLRMPARHVKRRALHVDALRHSERIDPGVELDAAPVRLVDPIVQRVEARTACIDALTPSQIDRPRLDARHVDGVAGRAHLKEDGVEPHALHIVEYGADLALELRGRQSGLRRPVDVIDGRHPDAAHLALGRHDISRWPVLREQLQEADEAENHGHYKTQSVHVLLFRNYGQTSVNPTVE